MKNEFRIQRTFDGLATGYDLFNKLASLGLDKKWRQAAVSLIGSDGALLDVGTGTGDIVKMIARNGQREGLVVALDFSEDMLKQARIKCAQGPFFVRGEANRLPIASDKIKTIINAFVLRNLQRGSVLAASLAEVYRVLVPDGKFVFLDLTVPRHAFIKFLHRIYMKFVLPFAGRVAFRNMWPGSYLKSSIEDFLPHDLFLENLRAAGFKNVCAHPLSWGVTTIFTGTK